jgi:hypothetical protein
MGTAKGECEHRCRNTCAMLVEALQDEKKQIAYFETMLGVCDDPAIKSFVKELIETHGLLVNQIKEKLGVIKANAEVLDDIITGFEG